MFKNECQRKALRIWPRYLINGLGLVLKVQIAPPGSCWFKDGGWGVVMMGVDIRGGVMLGINMRREVPTEGCLTVAGSMHCTSRSSR